MRAILFFSCNWRNFIWKPQIVQNLTSTDSTPDTSLSLSLSLSFPSPPLRFSLSQFLSLVLRRSSITECKDEFPIKVL